MDHNWNLVYEDGDMKVSQMLVLLNYWLRLELILCLALSHTETLIWRVCNMWFFYWQRYTGEIMKKEVLYWILWRLPILCRYIEDDVSNVPNFFLVVSITSHWISFYRFHTSLGKLWISTIWLYRLGKLWGLSVSYEMSWETTENNFSENNKARNTMVVSSLYSLKRTKFMTEDQENP